MAGIDAAVTEAYALGFVVVSLVNKGKVIADPHVSREFRCSTISCPATHEPISFVAKED